MLVGGLANTSFVGLPMNEAFFGASSMATGFLIDQLGTYLVLSTLGITVAAIYSAGTESKAAIFKRIIAFPPLLAWLSSRLRWARKSAERSSQFSMA
jgi:predicted permease